MNVHEVIRVAENLLPGEPVGTGKDTRWQAIIAVGEFIESYPEPVWEFAWRWGNHEQQDLRQAIATCLLEHLLEHHFAVYFPRVEEAAVADPVFAETFSLCSQFGQALQPGNAVRFATLRVRLSQHAPAPMTADSCCEATWAVHRQDDNGNRFMVQTGLSHEEAERLAKEFEARGHKQDYWVEQEWG